MVLKEKRKIKKETLAWVNEQIDKIIKPRQHVLENERNYKTDKSLLYVVLSDLQDLKKKLEVEK